MRRFGRHGLRAGIRAAAMAALCGCGQGGVARAGEAVVAAVGPSIAGDYVCKADCRISDAPPSIEVDGPSALCHSELGGVFYGRVLSRTSVFCFNMIGTLSDDGATLVWSNGGLWTRRSPPATSP